MDSSGNMATTSNVFCGICEARHLSKAANFWCSECDEGLCMECQEHHCISKSSKQHIAISIDSYNKLPPTITKIVTYCNEHDMKYTNYCQHHEKLCCPACIHVDHKSCIDIQLLRHVFKTAKTSALLDSIEISIEDIKRNIKDIIEDRQRNITTIHDQRQTYQHEINQIRNKVNSYLDTLEETMLKDIDAAETEANAEIEQLIAKLSGKKHVTDNFVQNISAIKMYASDLQAFIGSKSIEAEVEAEEKYLHSLTKDGRLDQIRLKLNIETKLSNIESTIESFGTVTTETEPPLVVLKSGKDKQAQIMSVVPRVDLISVDEIKLSQISHFTVKEKKRRQPYEIRGITVLPDGRIILADSGRSRLFIVNDNGRLDNFISCQSAGTGPFDVTCIKDNEVAISTSRGIHIILIDSRTILKGIQTSGECRGIAHNNGTLICCVQSKGIQCIQIANQTITTLVEVHESIDQLGICVQGTKIYVTNFSYCFVDCYTLEGKHLWQFHNRSVLVNPTGSSRNGLYQPRALHFDEKNSTLLVAIISQPTYMYHVS